jgi:glucose-6-phosphate isomerase
MFDGEKINVTENRSVLHTALRRPASDSLFVDGANIIGQVQNQLIKMLEFVDRVQKREILGITNQPIDTIVNIGIGGSDLGPRMAYAALKAFRDPLIRVKFVSNIDPSDIKDQLLGLNPEKTMFVISSKTFTTIETMTNAKVARNWLVEKLSKTVFFDSAEIVKRHFVAVSTATDKCAEFGVASDRIFGFWDWVGGRYSLSSSIGLSLALGIGDKNFRALLEGMNQIDQYFLKTDIKENVIVFLGLLNVWYSNFFQSETHAILPYSQRLAYFPAYLQQLTMESNGKSVKSDGSPVDLRTGEVWFGEPGTNGQHAFYQLIHQGTRLIPVDFIAVRETDENIVVDKYDLQKILLSNVYGQAKALAFGRTYQEVLEKDPHIDPKLIPHKIFTGNRPSTIISMNKLTPQTLGELIALYEHITFVQGKVWEIDSFDQWGVQLGKELALEAYSEMTKTAVSEADIATETDIKTASATDTVTTINIATASATETITTINEATKIKALAENTTNRVTVTDSDNKLITETTAADYANNLATGSATESATNTATATETASTIAATTVTTNSISIVTE